jgi:hypothetical protein
LTNGIQNLPLKKIEHFYCIGVLYKSLTVASFTLTGVKALSSQCFADPFEKGECEEKLVRWSFNEQWGTCTPFVYGGCGGNDNNFADKLECAAGWSILFKLSNN